METHKKNASDLLNCSLNGQSISGMTTFSTNSSGTVNAPYTHPSTIWQYWTDYYYPQVIRESYPIYIQERAKDSGKQAFEIIKALQDKDLIKLDKVKDFVEAMDILIKIL